MHSSADLCGVQNAASGGRPKACPPRFSLREPRAMTTIPEAVERVIEYEATREAPPPGFPAFPEIPGGRYIREDFYALEMEHVWRKSWVCAGTEESLRGPGEYRIFDKLGIPLLLVRGRDRKLRCFYNTCRHRGAPV